MIRIIDAEGQKLADEMLLVATYKLEFSTCRMSSHQAMAYEELAQGLKAVIPDKPLTSFHALYTKLLIKGAPCEISNNSPQTEISFLDGNRVVSRIINLSAVHYSFTSHSRSNSQTSPVPPNSKQ